MQISLYNKRLSFIFCLTLFFTLFAPVIIPSARFTFFAPFLIIACYQKSFQLTLWLSFICGLILDLITSHTRLGLYSLDYCLTVAILHTQRRNFFADSLTTLPIMTFLFASLSTLIMALLLNSIEMKSVFSPDWIITDLVYMPAIDACYAFAIFILPALLIRKPRRRGKDYFL